MLLCTLAWEKGLSICGAAADGAAGCSGSGSVADVCASMTALQSSPSTAAIRFNLRRIGWFTEHEERSPKEAVAGGGRAWHGLPGSTSWP